MKAVWKSYPALFQHFTEAACDSKRDSKERATYNGLKLFRLSSHQFVKNLGALYDALEEMSELSLELQRRDFSLVDAHRAICRQLTVFEGMAVNPGPKTKMALDAVANGQFFGVELHEGRRCDVLIDHGRFFTLLAWNLRSRLLATRSSQENKDKKDAGETPGQTEYESLIEEIKVLAR